MLTAAFRSRVLKPLVELALFEPDAAEGTLDWLQSGSHVPDIVWLNEDGADGEVPTGDPDRPEGGATIIEPEDFSRGRARRRWAELIRLVYEVDPTVCPRCAGEMRVIAMIQEPAVIDKIPRRRPSKAGTGVPVHGRRGRWRMRRAPRRGEAELRANRRRSERGRWAPAVMSDGWWTWR